MEDTDEEWRVSPALPEYEVSSWGRVRRVPYEAPLPNGGVRIYGGKPHYGADSGPRKIVVFRRKSFKVHRLVCAAFNGPPPFPRAVVMHDDEDFRNNRPGNLVWGTQKQNLNAPGFLEYCRGRTGENSPSVKGRKRREGA